MNSTPDQTEPAAPDHQEARPDSGWTPATLGIIAMLTGFIGFYAVLDLLSPHYSGLHQKTTPYLLLFFWLPAVTIQSSRFPTWPAAALIVSLAFLVFAVGAVTVLLGVLAGPDTGLAILAGIAAAFAIAVGTIVVSRRRWPRADPSPTVSRATTRRETFFIWVAIFGRFAAFVALTTGIAVATSMLPDVQIDCACQGIFVAYIGVLPAALIALKRGGGRKEWAITILAGLLLYAVNLASIVISSWVFYLWDLRDNLTMSFVVLLGGLVPGLMVWQLLIPRRERIAQAAKEEPSGRTPAPGACPLSKVSGKPGVAHTVPDSPRATNTEPREMAPRDHIFAFEQAYYRYRCNQAYRQEMIRCGINAMLDGVESENMLLLASAGDSDDDDELVEFFLKAASEIGCDLPRPVDPEREWIARHSVKCLAAGLALPDFDHSAQLDRNLLVCLIELRKVSGNDEKVTRFTELLGKYVEERIDDYGEWMDQLYQVPMMPSGKNTDPVVTSAVGRIVRLIDGYSYSAIELQHHEESLSIAADLLNNAGKTPPLP